MPHAPLPERTDGEAANPGPPLVCVSSNLTALSSQHDAMNVLDGDIFTFQELRLTELEMQKWKEDLEAEGYQCVFGEPMPAIPNTNKSLAVAGGVGVFSRGRMLKKVAPSSTEEQELIDTKRFVHAVTPLGDGKQCLHVISFYGITNSARSGPAKAKNEEILAKLFRVLAQLGQVPILLMGDFNCNSNSSPALEGALRSGLWFDAALQVATATCCEPSHTCFAKETSVGTRIDLALLNLQAVAMLRDFRVMEDTGIKQHRPLRVELETSGPTVWFALPHAATLPRGLAGPPGRG